MKASSKDCLCEAWFQEVGHETDWDLKVNKETNRRFFVVSEGYLF